MPNTSNKASGRNYGLDLLRGVSIVLMVMFHFGYDLTVFGWAEYNTALDIEWKIFRAIIVSGFLLAVGMSSYLAYHQAINKYKLLKGVVKLFTVSLFITLSSVIMVSHAWVYFGIIHFIAVALPISVLFVRSPYLALIAGILCILGYWSGLLNLHPIWEWCVLNNYIPAQTLDVIGFFPWIGVVLIGIFLMHKNIFEITIQANTFLNKLVFLGKHSLIIYLIHQPILYALLGLADLILSLKG